MALSDIVRAARKQQAQLSAHMLPSSDSEGAMEALQELRDVYEQNLVLIKVIRKKDEEILRPLCDPILEKAETALEEQMNCQDQQRAIMRKSFEAVSTRGPAESSAGKGLGYRKTKQMRRAGMIQRLGCDGAMVVAATLPTYQWAEAV